MTLVLWVIVKISLFIYFRSVTQQVFLLPKILKLFGFERIWRSLFLKRVVRTKFDIYVFISSASVVVSVFRNLIFDMGVVSYITIQKKCISINSIFKVNGKKIALIGNKKRVLSITHWQFLLTIYIMELILIECLVYSGLVPVVILSTINVSLFYLIIFTKGCVLYMSRKYENVL
jgi:hypothetical protein